MTFQDALSMRLNIIKPSEHMVCTESFATSNYCKHFSLFCIRADNPNEGKVC